MNVQTPLGIPCEETVGIRGLTYQAIPELKAESPLLDIYIDKLERKLELEETVGENRRQTVLMLTNLLMLKQKQDKKRKRLERLLELLGQLDET